jgi:peptide/nickel transport system permease protein
LLKDRPSSIGTMNVQAQSRDRLPLPTGNLLAIALLAEAALSFLSLGVQPPAASWGGMLARAYNYIELAPEQMYAPGFAILVTALAFNALGESMRVALDPTMKRR